MDKSDLRMAKKKILKCLTEDVNYGINKRTGEPLKRRKVSQALFDKKTGRAIWSQIDLEMVMDKVVLGLYFALQDSNAAPNHGLHATGQASQIEQIKLPGA